jgi:hypothetical protein
MTRQNFAISLNIDRFMVIYIEIFRLEEYKNVAVILPQWCIARVLFIIFCSEFLPIV